MKYKTLEFLMTWTWKIHHYIWRLWRGEWIKYQIELLDCFVEGWDNEMSGIYAVDMFETYCNDEYSSKEFPYSPGSALIEDQSCWD